MNAFLIGFTNKKVPLSTSVTNASMNYHLNHPGSQTLKKKMLALPVNIMLAACKICWLLPVR